MENFFDVGIVAELPDLKSRIVEVCEEFNYTYHIWENFEKLADSEGIECRLLFSCLEKNDVETATEFAQLAKQLFPKAYTICVVGKTMKANEAQHLRNSGAKMILLGEEIMETSKLEFVFTQVLRFQFLPIKATDIKPETEITFDIFHLLPMRSKFLKFAFRGMPLSQAKVDKLQEAGEFYINRTDAERFNEYTQKFFSGAEALGIRCRSEFLLLCKKFMDLVVVLTNQSEIASFKDGEASLKQCRSVANELLSCLGGYGRAWEIINNSGIGEFGSAERAPTIAAYAGLFGMHLELEKLDEIMVLCLLTEIGLVTLPPKVTKKIRDQKADELTEEELKSFREYPEKSLAMILDRKLQIDQGMRKIVGRIFENSDGSGFPKGLNSTSIPIESQLIRFCKMLDQETIVRLGQKKTPFENARDRILQDDASKKIFREDFLKEAKKKLILAGT